MDDYQIRRAEDADLPTVMAMIAHSRQLMRQYGNQQQWTGGYPSEDTIRDDITHGDCRLICKGSTVIGSFALVEGREPTYQKIDGKWEEEDRPYGTLHRLASMPGQRGLFDICLDWCRRQVTSIRIDTHADNRPMLHMAETRGFKHCGVVYMEDGSPREAFQMLDSGCLCHPLQSHVERNILPHYDNYDAAHRRDHVGHVIQTSLKLASHYPVEINMVYVIAAYHDLGMAEGREFHHITSAQMLLADSRLKRWFSPGQLAVMAQAIEDHRASSSQEPRSIYGRIVAEADRDIRPFTIVRRTIQYGLTHYPTLSREEHYQRTLQHLQEKYGYGGYLRLLLPESGNAIHLEELRQLIADSVKLRATFETLFDEETAKKMIKD